MTTPTPIPTPEVDQDVTHRHPFVEEVTVEGHIVDSLLLPKILDRILALGGSFEIKECRIGRRRVDPSHALIRVSAGSQAVLDEILGDLLVHGAQPVEPVDAQLVPADVSGAFPDGFYCTSNLKTQIRLGGRWIDVEDQEMDCGIVIDPTTQRPRCLPMNEVKIGTPVVVGHQGVRVFPIERVRSDQFRFMGSQVSSEKPKAVSFRAVAEAMRRCKQRGEKILVVGGPAIVHTGSAHHLARLIRHGWVQTLFAGNALAAHDLEQSLYGTSLGVSLELGDALEHGHEHHLRTINTIRRVGGIPQAVAAGIVTSGIMYECVKAGVETILAGSIRDDGPLPDVITDVLVAQSKMRQASRGVGIALMIATALHSIAVGNLLPAWVTVVCVDINPATVTKLSDRGTFQTVGLVTDVEPFLRTLAEELIPTAEGSSGSSRRDAQG